MTESSSVDTRGEIRRSILQEVGGEDFQKLPLVEYLGDDAENDRRFNVEELKWLLRYLDVEKPTRSGNPLITDYVGLLSKRVSFEVDGTIEIDPRRTGQWAGFKKDELLKIEKAVEEYEPIGEPDKEELVEHIQTQVPDAPAEIVENKVDRLKERRDRMTPHEELRPGFKLEDVQARQSVYLTLDKT